MMLLLVFIEHFYRAGLPYQLTLRFWLALRIFG